MSYFKFSPILLEFRPRGNPEFAVHNIVMPGDVEIGSRNITPILFQVNNDISSGKGVKVFIGRSGVSCREEICYAVNNAGAIAKAMSYSEASSELFIPFTAPGNLERRFKIAQKIIDSLYSLSVFGGQTGNVDIELILNKDKSSGSLILRGQFYTMSPLVSYILGIIKYGYLSCIGISYEELENSNPESFVKDIVLKRSLKLVEDGSFTSHRKVHDFYGRPFLFNTIFLWAIISKNANLLNSSNRFNNMGNGCVSYVTKRMEVDRYFVSRLPKYFPIQYKDAFHPDICGLFKGIFDWRDYLA